MQTSRRDMKKRYELKKKGEPGNGTPVRKIKGEGLTGDKGITAKQVTALEMKRLR